jgi:hypothetical protein
LTVHENDIKQNSFQEELTSFIGAVRYVPSY